MIENNIANEWLNDSKKFKYPTIESLFRPLCQQNGLIRVINNELVKNHQSTILEHFSISTTIESPWQVWAKTSKTEDAWESLTMICPMSCITLPVDNST